MSFYMMNSYQWLVCCKRYSFSFRHTYKQCTNKPRSICYSYSCYVI